MSRAPRRLLIHAGDTTSLRLVRRGQVSAERLHLGLLALARVHSHAEPNKEEHPGREEDPKALGEANDLRRGKAAGACEP